ncbi:DNA topoisomerase III [Shewanella sp. M16]|uniref:DNA topoisomerase III n=1 Tax=Shewanella sp. M16 TaxID=2830837 RepID=UPI001BAFCDA2|nr:DNA topoisomerase III [Shewanella sp. M16]MBS0044833.1 DNA topoisomerase III [Shewanella sp. M16]
MKLFIAEKPSLAQAIYEGLGGIAGKKMQGGYYEIGDNLITSCFGHMLELFDPEDYDAKYKNWVFDDLPIKAVYPPKLKPKAESKDRLDLIIKLVNSDKIQTVVNAGDRDQEGQLLIDEILTYCNNKKPVLRLLVADLNLAPMQKALADLRPNEDFKSWSECALARSIGDQLFGYNLTRAHTLKAREQGFDGVLNTGRVQSAVLGLINSRTLANKNHEASFYYDISANVETKQGIFKTRHQPSDSDIVDEKNRIIDESNANNIIAATSGNNGVITDIANTTEKKAAPMPYSLSRLQQTCAKKFGYSAEETLNIAQSLYETHKLLAYPRSDSSYLSDEHLAKKDLILQAVAGTRPDLQPVIDACQNLHHKAFDASKIEAHHAICPTEKSGEGIKLTEQERNVYELVAKSFIALFYPEAIRDKTKVTLSVKDHTFVATQTVLKSQGWESLFKGDIEADKPIEGLDLSLLSKGLDIACLDASFEKKKTTPPKYFVESTLLAAMTRAAKYVSDPELRKVLEAKDKDNANESGSIGTEATRAGILAKIADNFNLVTICEEKGYKEKVWKTTEAGQEFCAALPNDVIAPDISAVWSGYTQSIEKGEMTIQQFIEKLEFYLDERITDLKLNPMNISSNMEKCPNCEQGHLSRRKGQKGFFYACTNYPDCKSTFPELNGKPNLQPKAKVIISAIHKCPECESGLVRRRKTKLVKGKPSFFWGCSAYPECTQIFSEKGGLPVFPVASK